MGVLRFKQYKVKALSINTWHVVDTQCLNIHLTIALITHYNYF